MGHPSKVDRNKRIQSARERAAMTKHIQEEALARLPLNTLYIVLWIRSDPPQQNDFHWGYYLHTSPQGGFKYHAKNLGSGWIPDHGPTNGVFKSNFLCVLIQIATVPQAQHVLLDRIMRTYDHQLNQIPRVTCRVWLVTILRILIQQGLVRCSDAHALEQECFNFGNQYSHDAAENKQPRPVVRSRLCA